MYSRQHRTSQKPSYSTHTPPENRFAPKTNFVQPQPEQETQLISQEELDKITASESNWPDVSMFTYRPAPAPPPRVQMKLTLPQQEKQPEEKTEDNTIDDEKIDLLSDEQASTETSTPTSAPEIQTKLNIGEAGDKYEQEADQVTDKVVNQISTTQSPPVQREEQTETGKLPAKSISENLKNHANSKTNKLFLKETANSIRNNNKDLSATKIIQLQPTNNKLKSSEQSFLHRLKKLLQFLTQAINSNVKNLNVKLQQWINQQWIQLIKQLHKFKQFVIQRIFKPLIDKIKATIEKIKEKIKTARVIATGKSMVGTLKWRGGSGPDRNSGYQVSETTTWGHQNDFAKWIRGNGPEPNANSTMNCWEGVLFIAYKAGAIKKSWLVEVHQAAAQAGNKVGGDPGVDAYYNVLKQRMNYNKRKSVPFDKKTGKRQGNIPAGSIIFIGGLDHVVLAQGTKDSIGRHKVLSLWVLPAPGPTKGIWTKKEVGVLQDTTLEEVSDSTQTVEFAPAPW
ncbi:MAG TPA: hypothetical protein VK203_31125 [Nostocaceae cyanobacterium]|nr:hypothetical protein [Nostocaceae cyanobacterium]